jgi:hypothetical protein
MRKLKLRMDDLAVDSFSIAAAEGSGTVRGREITQNCGGTDYCTLGSSCDGSCYASCGDPDCGSYYCTGDNSCYASCADGCTVYGSCEGSCWATCTC